MFSKKWKRPLLDIHLFIGPEGVLAKKVFVWCELSVFSTTGSFTITKSDIFDLSVSGLPNAASRLVPGTMYLLYTLLTEGLHRTVAAIGIQQKWSQVYLKQVLIVELMQFHSKSQPYTGLIQIQDLDFIHRSKKYSIKILLPTYFVK